MGERGGELVATNEPPVVAEPLLDAMVMEDSQGDGGLSNSASADESERDEVFCATNDPLDQLVTSIEDPRWWRWRFSGYPGYEYKLLDSLVAEVAHPVGV